MDYNFMSIVKVYLRQEIEGNRVREKIDLDNRIKEELIKQLELQLAPIIINVLYSEYEGFKDYYKLDPTNAIIKYNEKINEPTYFNDLSKQFPVMRKKLDFKIKYFLDYIDEIVKNLELHKAKTGYKKINEIKLALGDTHSNGKTVCQIKIDGCDYIYKPRNATLDVNFISFVSRYISDYDYKIYNYNGFSIHELVKVNQFQKDQKSINKYFYNIGFISAIFYFLGATDMHYENIIVNGRTPIFVDLETISDITDFEQGKTHNNLFQLLSNSIFQSMIYPFEMNDNYLNISALTGEEGVVPRFHYTNIKPVINDTGELEFLEENPSLNKQKNEIYLNNVKQLPSFYQEDLVSGFTHFCKIVMDNREVIFDELTGIIQNNPVRQVIRPTHIYAKYLNVSLEAYYLKEEQRDQELYSHLGTSKSSEIIKEEISSLIQGDIPLFYGYLDSKHLYTHTACLAKNYFSITMRENIQSRIFNFDNKKMAQEVNNIKSSMLIYHHNHTENEMLNNQSVTTTNEQFSFEYLTDFDHLFQSINDSTSAILPSFLGDKLIISPITPSIYEYGGNLLLLMCFRDKLGIKTEKIIDILKTMKEWKTYNSAEITGFNGVGAYIYLLYNGYRMTGEEWFYNQLVQEIIHHSKIDNVKLNNLDYFTGVSGFVTLLSEISLNLNEKEIKEPIESLLKKYVEFIYRNYSNMEESDTRIGLAHGYSGLILALSRYDSINNSTANQPLIGKLVELEEQCYDCKKNNYLDYRDNTYDKYYICYGIVGVLFSRIELFENGYTHLKEDITQKALKLCTDILDNNLNLENYSYCLCHGIGGLIELVEELKNLGLLNDKLYYKVNNKLFTYLEKNQFNGLSNDSKYDSFMLGIGGIVYSFFRRKYKIPSIIRLKSF